MVQPYKGDRALYSVRSTRETETEVLAALAELRERLPRLSKSDYVAAVLAAHHGLTDNIDYQRVFGQPHQDQLPVTAKTA